MPQPALSPQERRLSVFCRNFSVVYAAGAAVFALFPRATLRLVTPEVVPLDWTAQLAFWNVLAVGMMAASATACAVVAPHPRERRNALLPVLVAKLACVALAALHLAHFHGPEAHALVALVAVDLPLFVVTLVVYRAAAPGVHLATPIAAPPAQEEAPKVQLGISKPEAG